MKNLKEIQQTSQARNLELIAKQVVEGFITGMHKSPFHGFSVEFAEHKIYNKGESTKHIDWKLFARTEKLFVKKYEEETNLRCQIIIDTSSSMLFPYKSKETNKLQFSVYSAAVLMYILKKQRDAYGISLISDKIELHTQAKTSSNHQKLIYSQLNNLLDLTDKNKKSDIAKQLHYIAENTHKRSLIILFSDMFNSGDINDYFSALQHLKHKKHEIIIFHVIDKKHEQKFDFNNKPYKFIDLETGEELKLNPNDIRADVNKNISEYFNLIKQKAIQYKIDFIEADINKNFDQILVPYLIKRQKLY